MIEGKKPSRVGHWCYQLVEPTKLPECLQINVHNEVSNQTSVRCNINVQLHSLCYSTLFVWIQMTYFDLVKTSLWPRVTPLLCNLLVYVTRNWCDGFVFKTTYDCYFASGKSHMWSKCWSNLYLNQIKHTYISISIRGSIGLEACQRQIQTTRFFLLHSNGLAQGNLSLSNITRDNQQRI
jgi:hypothetical protein